jgi:hypothetical protein
MTEEEWQKAKSTFPWRHQVVQNGIGGQVFVFDNAGAEVPLFTMIAVTERLTIAIANKAARAAEEAKE